MIHGGKIQQTVRKSLLPTYDIFDEYRYFEPNREFNIVEFKGSRIALTVCEDLWDDQPVENRFSRSRLYTRHPLEEMIRFRPDIVVNIAASPFAAGRMEIKKHIFTQKAAKHHLPVLMVNQVGANTELIFEGGSLAVAADGTIEHQMALFEEDFIVLEDKQLLKSPAEKGSHASKTPGSAERMHSGEMNPTADAEDRPSSMEMNLSAGTYTSKSSNEAGNLKAGTPETGSLADQTNRIAMINDGLVLGIRDYFRKSGFTKATLGLSGGIDSAVTLAIAVQALGHQNMHVLLMRSQYSSGHSITDSEQMAKTLKVNYDIIPIKEIFNLYRDAMQPVFGD